MMKSRLIFGRALAIVSSILLAAASGIAAQSPLSADEIMHRAAAHSESSEVRSSKPNYTYTKHTVTEEMNPNGDLKERREKVYQVNVEGGLTYAKLVQMNGQNLSAAELRKQQEKETAERQKITESRLNKKGDDREIFLTTEIVERFQYKLVKETELNGRATYVIVFQPKTPKLPIKKMTDRFLNEAAGTIWVDKEEFEVAKIDLQLQSEVALWGGMIGTLKKGRFTLERTRMADGAWFNSASNGLFEGRKLFEPMRIQTKSESSNFRRLALAKN